MAEDEERSRRPVDWRTVFMVVGSALLGGTAVALWNRRALSEIQGRSPARQKEPLDQESYESAGKPDDPP